MWDYTNPRANDDLIQLDQFSVEQNLLKFRSEMERCGIVQCLETHDDGPSHNLSLTLGISI